MFRSSIIPLKEGRTSRWEHLPSRLAGRMGQALGRYHLWPTGRSHGKETFIPRVEVIEDDKGFQVDAELPGVDAADIDISLTPDTLTIKGDKKVDFPHGKEGVYCSERFFGSFSREICLPRDVDVSRADALYDNGVLYINLPKLETETHYTKIPIKCFQA